jgi:uncharacterized protein (TIGR02466 family)
LSQELLDRAVALYAQGRAAEALAITGKLVAAPDAPHRALVAHSSALKALGRTEEALVSDQLAAERFPRSGVAWHNLAATLGDLGHGADSKAAIETGFALGLQAPQSYGVYARALMASGDPAGAERAYVENLKRDPKSAETARDYANLVWMRRGDLASAQAILDNTFHAGAPPGALLLAKAKLFEAAGQADQAAKLLIGAAATFPDDLAVVLSAAHAAVETSRLVDAERLAKQAEDQAPNRPSVLNQLCIVYLALGMPKLALEKARKGLAIAPGDQSLWGWAAMAARAVGDPLYETLYDYDRLIGVYDIATPAGWPSLEAYLADLAKSLRALHAYQHHPADQSLRGGTQTLHMLTGSDDPAIRAFFAAIDAPIRQHMTATGGGEDTFRSRNTGDYRIQGAWSVLLKPGGFHKDHFHSQGWLSSAFYVETPDKVLDGDDRQGWIRFGQPPIKTDPMLAAAHHIRPQPGRLVLFPSYMWHGTVPFTGDQDRMTMAFDAVPA